MEAASPDVSILIAAALSPVMLSHLPAMVMMAILGAVTVLPVTGIAD